MLFRTRFSQALKTININNFYIIQFENMQVKLFSLKACKLNVYNCTGKYLQNIIDFKDFKNIFYKKNYWSNVTISFYRREQESLPFNQQLVSFCLVVDFNFVNNNPFNSWNALNLYFQKRQHWHHGIISIFYKQKWQEI